MNKLNKISKRYWNKQPCNIKHSKKKFLSKEYFNEISKKRYFVEPHIKDFAQFSKWKNKNVLEIGFGIGTDAIEFLRNGAYYYGIELSDKSFDITKARINLFGSLILGIPLCLTIFLKGMACKQCVLNQPIMNFETSQSTQGMNIKYLMAGFLIIFALTMLIQFVVYFLRSLNIIKEE